LPCINPGAVQLLKALPPFVNQVGRLTKPPFGTREHPFSMSAPPNLFLWRVEVHRLI
jgi:hypothetical protein